MQRRVIRLLLSALLIPLTGCGASPAPSGSPTTSVSVPRVAPAPTVEQPAPSAVPADPNQICRVPDGEVPHLMEALAATLKTGALESWAEEVHQRTPCLTVNGYETPEHRVLLLANRFTKDSDSGAVLWQDGGRWVAAAVPLYQHSGVIRYIPQNGEYFVATRVDGTGGYGRLIILRDVGPSSGGIRADYSSGTYEHFGIEILDDDHIVLSGRSTAGAPMATTANCCMPGTVQRLVVRSGAGFKETSERHVPSPHYTVDVFIGCWRRHYLASANDNVIAGLCTWRGKSMESLSAYFLGVGEIAKPPGSTSCRTPQRLWVAGGFPHKQ